jgi:hypothetical protein
MVSIAGQFLNMVLEDLKYNRNLKINRVTQMITVSVGTYGPFALESDYLRTYDLFFPLPTSGGATQGGLTEFLYPVTMEQFDAEFKAPSMSNYPYEYATDLSTDAQVWSGGTQGSGTITSAGQLFIYPQSSGTITLTHRYMSNQPDIATPETSSTIPWFPFTQYLIRQTAALMMGVTGDDREATYLAENEKMLRPFLIMEGDEQATTHQIKLDPLHFKGPRGLKNTKAAPL